MTLDEIKLRESRVADARVKLQKAQNAVEDARDEYAEQEAKKAGIFYGKTKVRHKRGAFFVAGRYDFWINMPLYNLVKIKKDGTMSNAASGVSSPLCDLTIISEETP